MTEKDEFAGHKKVGQSLLHNIEQKIVKWGADVRRNEKSDRNVLAYARIRFFIITKQMPLFYTPLKNFDCNINTSWQTKIRK